MSKTDRMIDELIDEVLSEPVECPVERWIKRAKPVFTWKPLANGWWQCLCHVNGALAGSDSIRYDEDSEETRRSVESCLAGVLSRAEKALEQEMADQAEGFGHGYFEDEPNF